MLRSTFTLFAFVSLLLSGVDFAAREHFRLRIRDKCPTQHLNSKENMGRSSAGGGASSNAAGAPGVEGKPGSERGAKPSNRTSQPPK
jgi:hypothetical protein